LLPVTLSPEECKAIAQAGSARIDLDAPQVSYGDGEVASFEIDPEIKRRLLDGLDDIALTMFETELIDAYEATMERHGPVTTAL
jgi:3-isopropylmalate/(R)-2-methylmalate dehydratase small subunit